MYLSVHTGFYSLVLILAWICKSLHLDGC